MADVLKPFRLFPLALAATLAGCVVGPDFVKPPSDGYAPAPHPDRTVASQGPAGAAQGFGVSDDIQGDWWTLYHDRKLDALIAHAIAGSPTLEAAQATLRSASANLAAARAGLLPIATATVSANESRTTGKYASTASQYGASVGASYTVDVFGGVRRMIEMQQAALDLQRFSVESSYLALTSNVITTALQEALLSAELSAEEEIRSRQAKQLEIIRIREQSGAESPANVLTQESVLLGTESALTTLRTQRTQIRHLLAVYLGDDPATFAGGGLTLSGLMLPTDLPSSVPAKLTERRPDIRQAEAALHQASAAIGVAVAARIPDVGLTAALSTNSGALPTLFSSGLIGLGASVTQTLFDGGALAAREDASRAAYDAAAATYRQTVLSALQNVCDVLAAIDADAQTLSITTRQEERARQSLEISEVQYQYGKIRYADLLNAEEQYQSATIARLSAMASRFSDTAVLYVALGGGWWHRREASPIPTAE
ncbi:efflux transporter outer membrane subunit [Nitrospirillum sp. BR 11828]|uniref:efflux transporter outer membrane subunit n=1 Tax=Nitrospirillum sp. BR 11828 TaxID=3104325 RepID=UPI002ACA1B24|nr:efflux transporter outer membrane subunit [Nitrospirillum sp. BR 11828]MDZ5648036.1 efflux transporter outer membrane subunit [Nitrospirillum sp. BR 11828]